MSQTIYLGVKIPNDAWSSADLHVRFQHGENAKTVHVPRTLEVTDALRELIESASDLAEFAADAGDTDDDQVYAALTDGVRGVNNALAKLREQGGGDGR